MRNVVPHVWVAVAGVGVALVGLLGPWAKIYGLVSTSISGLDTDDGKFLALFTLLAGGFLAMHVFQSGGTRSLATAAAAGTLLTIVGLVDLMNIASKTEEASSDLAQASVGWGAYATVLGGAMITLGSFLSVTETRKRRATLETTSASEIVDASNSTAG